MTTSLQNNQIESRGLPATTETPMSPTDGKYADRDWSDWAMLEEDDDGEWAKLEEDSKAKEGMPTPAVLECTVDRKSFSTRRVVKYLYSMPSAAPHNILWLYRRGKDRNLQVEFFSKVHAIRLLQSHKHQAFVFNLKPSELHPSAQVPIIQNWISHGESIHIRLHIPMDQSRETVVNMFQSGRAQSEQQVSTGPLQIQIPPRKRNTGEEALISEDIPYSSVQSRDNVMDGQQIVKGSKQTSFDSAVAAFVASTVGIRHSDFWRSEDTKVGYCFGCNNLEIAHRILERLPREIELRKWLWRIDCLNDRAEILNSLEDFVW